MTSLTSADRTKQERALAPARVVTSVLKLVKACLLYDDSNQAVQQLVGPTLEAISTFCLAREADSVKILFAGDIVFVNRRVLRAGRDMIMLACELGELLARCNLSEVTFVGRVGAGELLDFARQLADGQRDPNAAERLRHAEIHGVSVRWVELSTEDWLPSMERSLFARVVRDYAASTLFMRRFYADLEQGELHVGNRVKRVAQKLVVVGDEAPQLAVALAAARLPDDEPGRIVVSTAIIACGMARLLGAERTALVNLAMASLMTEVGKARFQNDVPQERLPASALVILAAAGQMHPSTISRSVIVHDALEDDSPAVSVLGSVLRMARDFNRVRIPVKGRRSPGVDGAIAAIEQKKDVGDMQPFLQLLMGALGFFPVGTIVQLDTGEVAAVAGVPKLAVDYRKPPVRLLSDASSNFLPKPRDVDLAASVRGEPPRSIRRALGTLDGLRGKPS